MFLGAWPYFDEVENGRAFEPCSMNRSPDQKLLAVGDTAGHVKLYTFPCVNKEVSSLASCPACCSVPAYRALTETSLPCTTQAEFTSVKAHAREVAKVRFNCDGM